MRRKLVLVTAFCVVAVYLFVASYSVPSMIFQPLGGDGYLRIVSVVLLIATFGWLTTIVIGVRRKTAANSDTANRDTVDSAGDDAIPDRGEKIVPWFALSTIVYAVAVFTIGYFVSTFVFLLGTMMLCVTNWRGKVRKIVLLAVGMTAGLLILFRAVRFYVPDAWLI